ncbi:MAG: ParA family protein [Anaerolineae bacterium]|jgi:chromosome partitioning protein
MNVSLSNLLERIRRTVRRIFRRPEEPQTELELEPPQDLAPALDPDAEPGQEEVGRIIGILNFKGGTGKTTTVVHLAAGLAERGKRVLCIDLDAQGGLARYLDTGYTNSLADLLLGRATAQDCIVPARESLDLIAGDGDLVEAERALWQMGDEGAHLLAQRMRGVTGYDYVLLDYSPSANILGEAGLHYNREVIVPVTMDYMALVGTRRVIETLKKIERTHGHHVELTLIVPTFYDERQRLDREVIELLEKHFPGKIAEPIRTNVRLTEAPSHGMTVYEYAPSSSGAAGYTRLVERVMESG